MHVIDMLLLGSWVWVWHLYVLIVKCHLSASGWEHRSLQLFCQQTSSALYYSGVFLFILYTHPHSLD